MIEIILLELISLVSFLYAIILIFFEFTSMNQLAGVFIWTIVSSVIISISIVKSKAFNITVILLLAPLILYRDFKYIVLILTTAIIIFLYIQSSLGRGKYNSYANTFKKSLILYIVLMYLKIIFTQFQWFLGRESIFLIIFLLTSIVLIRSIRHLDTNIDSQNIKISNRKYIVSIISVFIIGTFENFRNSILIVALKIYDFVEYALYILTYPLIQALNWFYKQLEDPEKVTDDVIYGYGEMPDIISDPEVRETFTEYVQKNFLILKILSATILFIIVIYILYKLLIKTGEKNYVGREYTEHREYIKNENKKKRRIFGDRYPRNPKDQVRYYYRKYLDKINKEEIEVLKTDTTYDINKKAKDKFNTNIEKIRDIYIGSRYGNRYVDKEDVEIIKALYKNL